jgi:hypothetical protein
VDKQRVDCSQSGIEPAWLDVRQDQRDIGVEGMSDYSKLQAQAEAATPGPWFADNSRHEGSVNSADRHIGMVSMYAEKREDIPQNFANQEFIAAANPAVVLELIADLDGYKQGAKAEADAGDEAREEVRNLKAEVERMTKIAYAAHGAFRMETLAERDKLKAELEEDKMHFQAMGIALEGLVVERDQFKAEVDRLKQENRLLTEHNEFLASSDSRLAPELRAVKDALGLDFTASVRREVVPTIEALREDAELHAQIQRAAVALPGAWSIEIMVENGAGVVSVFDDDGNEVEFDGQGRLSEQVSDAIDLALGKEDE